MTIGPMETRETMPGKGTILIVDDHPVNVKLLEKILKSAGYGTLAAENGPDGLHQFTGSVCEKDGTFYCFYTGHNPANPAGLEFVRLATSTDDSQMTDAVIQRQDVVADRFTLEQGLQFPQFPRLRGGEIACLAEVAG